jgi:hypothetical protein
MHGEGERASTFVPTIAAEIYAAVTGITGMRIVLERTAKSSGGLARIFHRTIQHIKSARPIEPGASGHGGLMSLTTSTPQSKEIP